VTDRLVSIAEEGYAPAREVIFAPGEPPDAIYFVRRGRVRLAGGAEGPRELAAPAVVGLADVLLDRPRAARATAVTDVEYHRVRADRWLDLLEDSSALARASVMALVRAVAALEEKAWAERPPDPRTSASRPPGVAGPAMSVVERLGVLMDVPLLRGAGVQVLSDLASMSEVAAFEPGQALFERAAPRDRFHVLVSGEVEGSREDPRASWRGGPGEIVCDVAWLADSDGKWQARAMTPVRALVFRVEDWFDLMEENFEMVRPTLAALAFRREELRGLARAGGAS
jgi:CRP-like cAMP-binding protein